MRFREHRGSLAESLATTIDVASLDDVVAAAQAALDSWGLLVTRADVTLRHYAGADDRCGWGPTDVVHVRGYGVFGFVECLPEAHPATHPAGLS